MNGREEHELKYKKRIENNLLSMPDYVTEWYNNLLASGSSIRTCEGYIHYVSKYFNTINKKTKDIKPKDLTPVSLDKFFISLKSINGKKASDSHSVGAWFALKNFFEFLTNRNYIEKNYVKQISKPKNRDEIRINEHRVLLSKDDFAKIIDAAKNSKGKNRNRDILILALLMSTGMRESALMEINMNDIDYENGKLFVIDKGEKRHEYILSDNLLDLLDDYLDDRFDIEPLSTGKPLFVSKNKNRISIKVVRDVVMKYTYQALGKALSPHKLRAGFCSIMYNETHDIEFVRRAVGHSSSRVTQRYIVTNNYEKKKASEIIDTIF